MIFQHELLKSLRSNGKSKAIESPEKTLSYTGLLNAADRVTLRLLQEGVRPQTMVGIQVNDRIDLICSIIGVLNAGCIFVPLDGTLPGKRLASIVKDVDLEYIVSSEGYAVNFTREHGRPVTILMMKDCLQQTDNKLAEPVQYPDLSADDSIYVYFTSGSTGRPKGIVGKNSSLLHFIQWEIEAFGIHAGTRVSQLISPYFDAFLRDIFVPLLAGGTICIPPGDAGFLAPDRMVSWIDEAGINLIHCVPSLFRVINNNSLTARHFKQLKYILLSGEKIIPAELEPWNRLFGARIQLVNLYGATESTMIKTFYLIQPEDVKAGRISIGTPIQGAELAILNKDLAPCKPLVPGDLYIISDDLTKGYLNNPALTHEKFVQLNNNIRGKLAYKTGDKARILADGKIDLMGREDRQVKLRGIRIELDEIEASLLLLDTVKNAVVIRRTEENGDESLVAYLIRKENAKGAPQWIKDVEKYLEDTLPEYMIPANIVEVDAYPLLSNGKIDYTALNNQLVAHKVIAPENSIEDKILSIWKEILGEKAISTDDSFHKIGGNSLSIMKLIGRIYKEYNVRISLSELFNNLTIKKQAEFIKRSNKDVLYVISKAAAKPAYHVSAAQERMFYSQQLNKESISYNLPMAWEIKGAYDKEKIDRIFRLLIARHEILRTEFKIENDELLQLINDDVDFQVGEIYGGADLKDAIPGLIKPFDLGKAPLLRCSIITGTGNQSILLVDAHHIICDGISQINLLTEFSRLYNGEELPSIDLQYKDYAEWEYVFRSTEEYLAHREFWLRSFEGTIPVLELPTAHTGISYPGDRGGSTSFSIPKELLRAMLEYQHREEMTTSSGLFSLYYLYLSQLTGQEDIVVGVAASGRVQQELETAVGMFVKMLPVRYRMDPYSSVKSFLKSVNNQLIQATSKQLYDLSNIVIELNNNKAVPVKNLFEVAFVFQNFEENRRSRNGNDFSIYEVDYSASKYPLTLFASEDNDAFHFKLQYLSAYFTKEDIDLLIIQFRMLAERLSQNLDASIMEVAAGNDQPADVMEDDISFNF